MGKWRCAGRGEPTRGLAGGAQTPPSDPPPAFNKKASDAAGRLWGYITGSMALLGECAKLDKRNARAYVDALGLYFQLNAALIKRIDKIAREENRRAGNSPERDGDQAAD
jgi:hypothetical protein